MNSFNNLFLVEELEERLEMTAVAEDAGDRTVSVEVSSEDRGSFKGTFSWSF